MFGPNSYIPFLGTAPQGPTPAELEAERQAEYDARQAEALRHASDNGKDVALAQIMGMKFAMQQAGLDRDMQRAASLELSLEKYDTRLQVGLLEFRQAMTAEENRHVEKIAADAARFNRMTSTTDFAPDIEPPL